MLLCFQIDPNCLLLVFVDRSAAEFKWRVWARSTVDGGVEKAQKIQSTRTSHCFPSPSHPICMISRIGWFLCSFFEKKCQNVVVFVNKSTSTNLPNFSLQLPHTLLCFYWQQRRIRKVSLALNVIFFFSQTLILLFKMAANNPHHPTLRLRQMNAFVVAKSFDKTNPNNSIAGSRKKITKI